MKLSRIVLASTLVISITVIAGCGANNTTPPSPSSTASSGQLTSPDTSEPNAATQTPSPIKSGVTKMLGITADLQSAIDTGDAAKVKVIGPKLEDYWSPFEDSVKLKYPDNYKKIEDFLDPTIAGSKSSPLDKQTLGALNDNLIKALKDLEAKE